MPSGLLNVLKPAGLTSRDVVNRVQRMARPAKAGHAGTLDPLATGVLVVCVGTATRLVEYVQRLPKRYLGEFLLGRRSPTDDTDGDVAELPDPPVPDRAALASAAARLVGRIMQRPPAFSALKVGGRRAYDLARRGLPVELAPREVVVYRLEIVAYDYPRLVLDIECSGGTYVRALGRDLAESLKTAAVMSALERMAIGHFRAAEAVALDRLDAATWRSHLQPLRRAVAVLPQIEISAAEAARLRNGQAIRAAADWPAADEMAACCNGDLAAIVAPRGPGLLAPKLVLPAE